MGAQLKKGECLKPTTHHRLLLLLLFNPKSITDSKCVPGNKASGLSVPVPICAMIEFGSQEQTQGTNNIKILHPHYNLSIKPMRPRLALPSSSLWPLPAWRDEDEEVVDRVIVRSMLILGNLGDSRVKSVKFRVFPKSNRLSGSSFVRFSLYYFEDVHHPVHRRFLLKGSVFLFLAVLTVILPVIVPQM